MDKPEKLATVGTKDKRRRQSKHKTQHPMYTSTYMQIADHLTNSDNILHMHDLLKLEYSYAYMCLLKKCKQQRYTICTARCI
jgi:hypothetical protein